MNARGIFSAAALALCATGAVTAIHGAAVPVQAEIAQRQLDRVFEQRLAANLSTPLAQPAKAMPNETSTISEHEPAKPVIPTDGPIARLTVERLGITQIVLASDGSDARLDQGPTLLKHGDAANAVSVLAAHRDTHFLFIRDLQAGDEVVLQLVTGETTRYRVTHFETVRWDNFAYPKDPAIPLLALTTCYPFGGSEYGGPLRRVAWAEQIPAG